MVKAGSAIDGGELEAQSQKFKVQFETTSGGVGTIILNQGVAASWLAAFNRQGTGPLAASAMDASIADAADDNDLPYGGDMRAAMRAQVKLAVSHLLQ